MSETPPRSFASPSASNSAESGLMPDLYRTAVGPVNAAYYQQQFQRFEALGKATPSWNHGAAFFTLAWLVLRRLWRPAMLYSALLLALLLLWWGLHGLLPAAAEAAFLALAMLVLCAVPGLMGNALYYHSVRGQTLQVLAQAPSLAQARQQLHASASSTERFHRIAAVQALASAALVGLLLYGVDGSALLRTPTPAVAAQAPVPNAPSAQGWVAAAPAVSSLDQALEQALQQVAAPEDASTWSELPASAQPQAASAATDSPLAEAIDAPPADAQAEAEAQTQAPTAVQPDSMAAAPLTEPASAASTDADADALSITTFAQAVPAASAQAAAPALTAATAAVAHAAAAATAPAKEQAPAAATPAAAPAAAPQPSKVKVSATAAAAAAKPTAHTPNGTLQPGKFYLNAGVYAQPANAQRATQMLTRAKLNVVTQTLHSNKGTMTRLRVGPFETRQQALQAAATVHRLKMETTVFQQPKK